MRAVRLATRQGRVIYAPFVQGNRFALREAGVYSISSLSYSVMSSGRAVSRQYSGMAPQLDCRRYLVQNVRSTVKALLFRCYPTPSACSLEERRVFHFKLSKRSSFVANRLPETSSIGAERTTRSVVRTLDSQRQAFASVVGANVAGRASASGLCSTSSHGRCL